MREGLANIKMETLCRRDCLIECKMVLKVCIKLQKFKGNDGIKMNRTRSYNHEMIHPYSPEIEKKIRKHLRPTNDSWRVDETYKSKR